MRMLVHPRFLSEDDCRGLADRLTRASSGGGYTGTTIISTWFGYVRWARNQITVSGEVCDPRVKVVRNINGAQCDEVWINETSDTALAAAVQRAERLARLQPETSGAQLLTTLSHEQPMPAPNLFDAHTAQLTAAERATAARQLIQSATDAGMLSAGYIEVSAHSQAMLTSWGWKSYCTYTWARYSVTVRDPTGVGSGWAGVDWPSWDRIKGTELSALALDKCLKSRNPVTVEPGKYTAILEPQAVAALMKVLVGSDQYSGYNHLDLESNYKYHNDQGPFHADGVAGEPFYRRKTLLGKPVVDERISIWADPMDAELGFPTESPKNFYEGNMLDINTDVFHAATWIEHGVLTHLSYRRFFGVTAIGQQTGLPNEGAFRMSGGPTSIEEMIASTPRGLLVTRLDQVVPVFDGGLVVEGYTRDGLWLIENGKISKPVVNFLVREHVLGMLNRVDQLGVPQRVFNPLPALGDPTQIPRPIIVPPLKVRDFNCKALINAI